MDNLNSLDLKHLFHPCSQMKDYEEFPLLEVTSAKDAYIYTKEGVPILDAISSWWCKHLGHGHPRLRKALIEQAETFEHVILANTTSNLIVELSKKLGTLIPGLEKVFYAGDGSMAVEIALKMSLQAQQIKGNTHKTKFIALQNGYHGESAGALGMSELGIYRNHYQAILPEVEFLQPIPYRSGCIDPHWMELAEWNYLEEWLAPRAKNCCAFILEPVLQGAGGMKLYTPTLLSKIRQWCTQNSVYLIADEILTGFGRTGKYLALDHAQVIPDFCCLSKGLTAGWLPFSCTLHSNEVYQLFYDDYEKGKSFLHSNTYCGNALGAAVALEALKIYDEMNIAEVATNLQTKLASRMQNIVEMTGVLQNFRGIGGVVAVDIPEGLGGQRAGFSLYKNALTKQGVFLRPLGNTLYWLPPLNSSEEVLDELARKTYLAVKQTLLE